MRVWGGLDWFILIFSFFFRFFLFSDVLEPVFLERQHKERGFAEHGGGNGRVKKIDLLFELGDFGF